MIECKHEFHWREGLACVKCGRPEKSTYTDNTEQEKANLLQRIQTSVALNDQLEAELKQVHAREADLRRRLEAAQDWINKAYVATEKIEQERDELRRKLQSAENKNIPLEKEIETANNAMKLALETIEGYRQQAAAYQEVLEGAEKEVDEWKSIATTEQGNWAEACVEVSALTEERDELRRQVEVMNKRITELNQSNVHWHNKFKQAEQQAAAYREALEQIEVLRSYEMDEACMIATKALYPKTPAPADNSYFDRVERQD